MSNQYLKLRRSSIPGKLPTTESIDFGEIALNTYDGLAFMKKSGSNGEEIVTLGASNTGSFVTTSSFNSFTASYTTGSFTGSFRGDGSGLINLPIPVIDTSSLATTGSNIFIGNQVITGSITSSLGFFGTASYALSSSQAVTASYTLLAQSASYATNLYNSNGSIQSNRAIDVPGRVLTVSGSASGSSFIINTHIFRFQQAGGGGSYWNFAEGELRNDIGTTISLSNLASSVGLKAGAGVNGTNRFIVNPNGSTWSLNSLTFNIGSLTNYASAILAVESTTKGLLLPRLTTAQRNSISTPVAGLMIYTTDAIATDASTGCTQTYNGSTWKNHW